MNSTSRLTPTIIAIAAAFGLVGFIVAMSGFDFRFFGSLIVGIIVAVIVAIILMLGWGDPEVEDRNETGQADAGSAPAPTPTADVAEEAAAVEAAPVAAAAMAAPAAATAEIKPSAALPGQDELAERKGEWKYEAPAPETKAAAPAKAKPKAAAKPKAKAAAKPKAAPKPKAAAKPKAKPVAADGKPEMLSAPRDGGGDDLKQIKGVGPKMEKMLNTMGVWHFDQVASWRKKEVEWVDNNLEGFKGRVSRDEWVKQAKVLAKGGTTEFSKKVKKGGVY